MCPNSPVSGPLETLVRLRRGVIPRTVSIALTTRLDSAHPAAGSRVFEAFARGVDAWLTRPERVRLTSATVEPHTQAGLFVETWQAGFPRMPPSAFAMLVRMVGASVPGARQLSIHEQADIRTLLVRDLELDSEATILDVPWQIAFVGADEPAVRIVFADPISSETIGRIAHVLQAWADVLALGGFPGAHGCPRSHSHGRVSGVDAGGDREIALRFSGMACGYDAWEALFEALAPVDEEASIQLVEIRGPHTPSAVTAGIEAIAL